MGGVTAEKRETDKRKTPRCKHYQWRINLTVPLRYVCENVPPPKAIPILKRQLIDRKIGRSECVVCNDIMWGDLGVS